MNLTKRSIAALLTPTTKRALQYDSQVRGLGVMVQPSGHRSFFWYRKVRGRPTWKTLGTFPDLTVEQARTRASELNSLAARWKQDDYKGADPFARSHDLTLALLLDNYVEHRLRKYAKDPDRAIAGARGPFDWYLNNYWKKRSLGSVRRGDVRSLHAEVGRKHGQVTANRLVQLLRTLYNWAIKSDLWVGENPAHGIALFPEKSRTRFLQPDECPKFFIALREEANVDLRDFVLLALFTGARRSNVLAMRWEELDLPRSLWTIPDPKNRSPHIIPLVDEAVTVLQSRRKRGDSNWVFPSDSKVGHVTTLKRSWGHLLKRAGVENFRIHDMRRTLGSWAAGAGVSLPIIGKTLGHKSAAATQIYSRLHVDPVRAAINLATRAMLLAGKVSPQKLLDEAPRG
jgi:integrase